jgi:molybdopterin molybdotransferase
MSSPEVAIRTLCATLTPVQTETVSLAQAAGRVLAAPVLADRDSPSCDVSAMDGYAVRLADLKQPALEVAGEAAVGQAPPTLPAGKTVRVFTGSPVPRGTEAVIQREDVGEEGQRIALRPLAQPPEVGLNIRRQGENLGAGQQMFDEGVALTAAAIAALANFGVTRVLVRRRVRVGILNTGSELVAPEVQPQPWQIRDSNGPSLAALLAGPDRLDVRPPVRVHDDYDTMCKQLAQVLGDAEAVFITGGVSAGQYDFVPDVIRALGGKTVFHRLPLRPGRPTLGAVGPQGQAILGLPGNPVSAMVVARRYGPIVLGHLAAARDPLPAGFVHLGDADDRTLPLWWCRLVRLTGAGQAALVPTRGSGDIVSLGRSDGFIELPPEARGAGPWPFYAWQS